MRYHGIFDKHKRPQRLQWQTGNEFDGSDFTGNRYTGGKGTKEKFFRIFHHKSKTYFRGAEFLKYDANKHITRAGLL